MKFNYKKIKLISFWNVKLRSQQELFRLTKKQEWFSMAIENVKLIHECFPTHLPMGTARMKEDKETDEKGKTRSMSMERSKAAWNIQPLAHILGTCACTEPQAM